MSAQPDLATLAGLLAERSRAAILAALADSGALPASELAYRAAVGSPTASHHLARLEAAGLVVAQKSGRHRYYRLSCDSVGELLKAMLRLAPVELRAAPSPAGALRPARLCFDHLAGRLGVALTEVLLDRRWLVPEAGDFLLTDDGTSGLSALGLDIEAIRSRRRHFARQCLDWSERRPHLGGALGAALADRLFALGWIERPDSGRRVAVTAEGAAALLACFGLDIAALAQA